MIYTKTKFLVKSDKKYVFNNKRLHFELDQKNLFLIHTNPYFNKNNNNFLEIINVYLNFSIKYTKFNFK